MHFEIYLLRALVQPFYYYHFVIRNILIITKAKYVQHNFKVASWELIDDFRVVSMVGLC